MRKKTGMLLLFSISTLHAGEIVLNEVSYEAAANLFGGICCVCEKVENDRNSAEAPVCEMARLGAYVCECEFASKTSECDCNR